MKSLTLLCLGAALLVVICAAEPAADEDAGVIQADQPAGAKRDPKLFFGGLYSTVTRFSVSLTTTGTRYFTCITSINNLLTCSGRRRRRRNLGLETPAAVAAPVEPNIPALAGSVSSSADSGVMTPSETRDSKALFLTIFTTQTSSITLGTFFSDTGTTVSISIGCFDPSFSFPPTCG